MLESQLNAIIHLLDDPDQQVYTQVRERLLAEGPPVVKALEEAWANNTDQLVQERIEDITHIIGFNAVKADLTQWAADGGEDLLEGVIIINRFGYPSLDIDRLKYEIDEIVRETWRHFHYEMSPVEQVKLLNHIFFDVYKFDGNVKNHKSAQNSYLNKVVETRMGNQISLSVLYSVIARSLNVPVYGVNLPQHFVLGYIDREKPSDNNVLFYINPFNKGQIFMRADVIAFLKQLKLPVHEQFTAACTNQDILKRIIRNLITAYEAEQLPGRVAELKELLAAF